MIDEWHLGNIQESSFVELADSSLAKKFVEVSGYVDPKCKACKWFRLCWGDCRRNRGFMR